jgi:ABC transport system ATP-binding/permease protein
VALITLRDVELSVGGPHPLLHDVALEVDARERICVVGRNGAGKSTLLRLLAGEIAPDGGLVQIDAGAVVARLAQEIPPDVRGSVLEVVAAPLGEVGALLAQYHQLTATLDVPGSTERLSDVQAQIDAANGWDTDRRINEVISRLGLPESADFAALSGGLKRRVLLARALVLDPDVLLLDEPTNHLDIDAIDWLENFLRGFRGSLVFITHDRRFLRALATRIVEIDRGRLTSWPGDYDNYLRRRAERLHAEEQAQAGFDRKLAQEEAWIRQGIKARRTRNEGRVRALEQMRRERAQRRARQGDVRMSAAEASRSGRRVIEAEQVSFAWNGDPVVRDFSLTVQRGDRIGLVGPNGAGKTTLLHLLLGRLQPQSGRVVLGTGLEIAYFDQQRAQLDENASAADNVAEGRDFVEIGGKPKHIIGYLQDFLFAPERARAPISRLSGGERNRLLLARLFARPSNLLVMDEPTNDLDVETLELLEELLIEYRGTLLLVSHDREFLDNVVTSVLVFHGGGHIEESAGGYSDWLARQRAPSSPGAPAPPAGGAAPAAAPSKDPTRPRKLSYGEKRELEQLPQTIETLEAEIAALGDRLADPALYQHQGAEVAKINARLAEAQAALDAAYARWAALEAISG